MKTMSSPCKKVSQKFNALTRIVNYMNFSKQKAFMKTIVISKFTYCPLVCMFQSRKLNNRINSIHERALRVKYQEYKSTFLELLQWDNYITIHQQNLQVFATEISKAKNDISPEIMKVFELKEPCFSLSSKGNYSVRGNVKTTHYGIQSIKYLASKIRNLVLDQIKHCGC